MIGKIFATFLIIAVVGFFGCLVTSNEDFENHPKWNISMVLLLLAGIAGMIISGILWIWI